MRPFQWLRVYLMASAVLDPRGSLGSISSNQGSISAIIEADSAWRTANLYSGLEPRIRASIL